MTFEKLGINKDIVRALAEEGITTPTMIQEKAIPTILEGKDLIGMSKTGSGKTAAFGVPILQLIEQKQGVQILIMTPTRELAVQISNELTKFSKYMDAHITTVFGGVAYGPQVEGMKRSEIIVGTPGRLLDHLQQGTLNLKGLKCLALDEADKMVDMGFFEDINRIISYAPRERQVLLFGATISSEVDRLKREQMKDPVIAKAESHVKDDFLEQYYYNTKSQEKFSLLVHLMKKENTDRVIVFCSTRSTVEILSKNLGKQGIQVEMIHGKLSQNRRLRVIEDFNKGKHKVLVASAVAARGLHIENVSHVFNYDLSQDPEEYIHRVGRTARAGESGKAITLLTNRDHDTFNAILSRFPITVEKMKMPTDFKKLRFEARSPSGRHGNRRSYSKSSYGGRSSHRNERTAWVNTSRFNK